MVRKSVKARARSTLVASFWRLEGMFASDWDLVNVQLAREAFKYVLTIDRLEAKQRAFLRQLFTLLLHLSERATLAHRLVAPTRSRPCGRDIARYE